jgi:hypothetical protein
MELDSPTSHVPSATGAAEPAEPVEREVAHCERSPLGTFAECPHCGGGLRPEHAHFRCSVCGWRDSCCD